MRIEVDCVAESLNPFTSKTRGPQVDLVLSLLDKCASRARLEQTFDLVIPDAENGPFAGKVMDHRLTVDITKAEWFGGRLRVRGHIHAVDGKAVNGKATV